MNNQDHDDPLGTDLADQRSELAVIGSILLEFGANLPRVSFLKPSDFWDSRHATIFARMCELYDTDEEMDVLTICGNDPFLHSICNEAYTTTHSSLSVVHHAHTVAELSRRRQIVDSLSRAAQMTYGEIDVDEVVKYMEEELTKHHPAPETSTKFDGLTQQIVTDAEAEKTGVVERIYIVKDFLREGSLSIVYGAPGAMKSAICMDMAMCVARGDEWLQQLPVEGNNQRSFETICSRVLWLNYDQGHEDVVERLGAMARAYGGGSGNLDAISFSNPMVTLTDENQARDWGSFLARESYRLLVVDSLLDIKGKVDLQEAAIGDVLRYWRIAAEESRCAIVIIAHNTKNTDDLYGSQFIKAKLDHLYKIVRPEGTDVVQIESEKQRSYGQTGKLYAIWTHRHYDNTRTLEMARFWGDGTRGNVHPNNTRQDAILNILMSSPGRGFNKERLLDLTSDDDEPTTLDAIRKAAERLVQSNASVRKTKHTNNEIVYHYGELADNS